MQVKTEKFGIISLDRLLGGGITSGSAILITSEHPATNKGAFTGYFALEQLGRDNGRVYVVDYSYPVNQLFDLPEIASTPSFLHSMTDAKRYYVVNCYGTLTYPDTFAFKDNIVEVDKPSDISKVKYVLDKLREDTCPKNENARWIFDDITNMYITIGEEAKILRFFRQMFQSLKSNNDLGLFYLDRNAHSNQFVSAIENMSDIIINLRVKEVSGVFIPHLRILKNSTFGSELVSTEVPYSLTAEGIRIQTKMLGDFEVMKKNLTLTSKNTLEMFGIDYILLPRRQYVNVIEQMYNTLDYPEYCKRNIQIGRTAAKEFLSYLGSFFQTAEIRRPYALMRQLSIFGFGKFINQMYDLEKGVVIMHLYDLWSFKASNPIHQEACGFLTAVLETATGDIWDTIETKCIATGDEYCELVASPARELGFLNLDLQKTKDKLTIDKDGTLSLEGSRFLLMDKGSLLHIFESAEDLVGIDRASEIMYNAGERMALIFAKQLADRFKLSGESIFRSYAQIIGVRGWGITEIKEINLQTGYARVTVKNTIIGSSMKQRHKQADAMVAGVVAGIIEFITKQKINCHEVKCIAKGDDICEFVAEPLTAGSEEPIMNP